MKNINYNNLLDFYREKRVLITGNTGFKGSWLTYLLLSAGAEITGYALEPMTNPSLFEIAELEKAERLKQIYGDVRNLNLLRKTMECFKPEIIFHLAAQPIVRDSFKDPVTTYSTNVMGTVNILECVRTVKGVRSFLNVTTDKVYRNKEWEYGYREIDELDGLDPYSNSKSCSELVTHSYKESFFHDGKIRISTARAGNVIGGGDFANDRIIPDCIRALMGFYKDGTSEVTVGIRNPYSIRPYQHVLESLFAYLLIAAQQYEDTSFPSYYNVGPDEEDCVTTGELVELFCNKWNKQISNGGGNLSYKQKKNCKEKWGRLPQIKWENRSQAGAPHEAGFLKLDCSKMKSIFNWHPRWHIDEAITYTVMFTQIWLEGGNAENIRNEMDREIKAFTE